MNDIYKTEQLIKDNKINKEAFYNILELLSITDRRKELKILEYVINSSHNDLMSLADELSCLKAGNSKQRKDCQNVLFSNEVYAQKG